MHATHVLGAQHQAIAALFDAVECAVEPRAREMAVARLAEELIAHMAGEETVFYPALRRIFGKDASVVVRARDEHLTLKVELRQVLGGDLDDAAALAEGLAVLRTRFEGHVREEEIGLFPRVERALSDADHEVLGVEILASRPPIWMVTTERSGGRRSSGRAKLRSRVSLPIPAARQ